MCVRRSDPSLLDAINEGDTAAKSPFVVVIRNAGIKVLDHIVNAVVLTSAFSSGNEFMYASARALFSLAQNGQAPVIFTKITKQGVPIYAVGVTFLFSMLSFLTVDTGGAEQAFIWLGNITALGSMITWWGIGITFLRFHKGMKVQGMSRDILPFHSSMQPYAAWAVVICFSVIIFFNGWTSFHGKFDVSNFFSSYVNIFFGAWFYFLVWCNLSDYFVCSHHPLLWLEVLAQDKDRLVRDDGPQLALRGGFARVRKVPKVKTLSRLVCLVRLL